MTSTYAITTLRDLRNDPARTTLEIAALQLAEQALRRPGRVPTVADKIVERVCAEYGVTVRALRSTNRNPRITWPRQVAYYLLREAKLSLPEIGRCLNRDHSTALHGIRCVQAEVHERTPRGCTVLELVEERSAA